MKKSFYNVITRKSGEKGYKLFNVLTGSIFEIDKELKECLEKGDFSSMDPKILQTLKKGGVIVNDETDEKREFKVLHEFSKYGIGPLALVIVPTYKCNMACKYCYLGCGEALVETMSNDVLTSVITFVQNRLSYNNTKQLTVNFYGGEPMLEPEKMLKFLEAFKPYILNNLISTNGTLFTNEVSARLKDYPTSVQLTLAGPREIHDKKRPYKNGSGTYDDIIEGIHRLIKAKIYTNVRVDVDAENYDQIGRLLDDLADEGVKDDVFMSFVRISPIYYAHDYPLCLSNGKRIIHLWKMGLKKGFKILVGGPVSPYVFCLQQTSRAFTIDPLGDLYPCTGFLGDKKHRIGSLDATGEWREIGYEWYDWLSRNPLSIEKCKDCKAVPICSGGCAFRAHQKHGMFHKPFCGEFGDPEFLKAYLLHSLNQSILAEK